MPGRVGAESAASPADAVPDVRDGRPCVRRLTTPESAFPYRAPKPPDEKKIPSSRKGSIVPTNVPVGVRSCVRLSSTAPSSSVFVSL